MHDNELAAATDEAMGEATQMLATLLGLDK